MPGNKKENKIIPFDLTTLQLMISGFVAVLVTALLAFGFTMAVTKSEDAKRDSELNLQTSIVVDPTEIIIYKS